MPSDRREVAKKLFRQRGGMLRTSAAVRLGVHPRILYGLAASGELERVSRGLYRLADLPPLSNPDFVSVAARVPNGVICLVSALAFHELTTQVPHEVYLAVPRGAEPPRIDHPPVRLFWFAGPVVAEGVEVHEIDGVPVRIYSVEKTLADCFKYRNKIGLEVGIEALKLYRSRQRIRVEEITHFARVCRVERFMRPYLEALL